MNPNAWSSDQPLVRIADVHKSFGPLTVLSGVSLDVKKGEVICVIGPSGSGKSTLLRCINALVSIERGSMEVRHRSEVRLTQPRAGAPRPCSKRVCEGGKGVVATE